MCLGLIAVSDIDLWNRMGEKVDATENERKVKQLKLKDTVRNDNLKETINKDLL